MIISLVKQSQQAKEPAGKTDFVEIGICALL